MNAHNPFDAKQDWTNPYCQNSSNDPMVDALLGNAYHVVRTVYCNLGNLKLLYDFLNQYGMVIGVNSEEELKSLSTQVKYSRIYGFSRAGDRQVTDYLYVEGDRTGILPNDTTATGSWITVATSGSSGGGTSSGEGAYIPWVYANGSAAGGETTINVPDGTVGVPFIIVNGDMQYVGRGFAFNVDSLSVTLAQPLEEGDEVVFLLTGVPAVPDNPNINDWIQINWLYNNGAAVGGEQVIAIPYTFQSIPAVYKNGLRLYKGLTTESYTADPDNQRIFLTEPLTTNDRLIVQIGGEARVLETTDRTVQEIARSLNVRDSSVILSTNTTTTLNDKEFLYAVEQQKVYELPPLPSNVYITSVSGQTLTYNPGGVQVGLKEVSAGNVLQSQIDGLRDDLVDTAKGDGLIGVKQPYQGAVSLTQHDNNALFLNVKQFGAIGDGAYHPLSEIYTSLSDAQAVYPFVTALTQSVDWAAWQAALNTGKVVYGTDNAYVITDTLLPVSGGGIIGLGVNKWVSGFTATFNPNLTSGTSFLMYGTGPKNYTLDCVTNMDKSGGVVANPSASDPYTSTAPAPSYDLLDFTNGDASGATRATLKPFSAAIVMPETGCVRLENFRIVPYFNGLDGYKDIANTGLGDEWDVGIWSRASFGNEYRNLQVVGYWRKTALLKTNIPVSDTLVAQGEDENYYHCRFQGFKGVSIRAHDVFRITAVTSSTIEIPWSASHTFETSGVLRSGGRNFTYSGLSVSGDKLVFTGVSNTSEATVGSTIRRNDIDNFGMAGTQFFDCYITSLYHHTHLLATSQYLSQPFSRPSECMEVSGEPVRGVQVHAGTIQGWDDVLIHLHDCGNMNFYSTYFESQQAYVTINGGNAIGYGARMIASRQSTSSLPYAAGNTRVLRMVGCSEGNGVDFGPEFAGYSSGRFVTGQGVFNPRDSFIDHRAFPAYSDSDVRVISEKGHVKVVPYVGKFVYVGPTSGDANVQSTIGSLNLLSGLRVRFGSPATYWATIDAAKIAPTGDNSMALGQPSNRFSTIYAGTGTISTSDETLKTREDITQAEKEAALEIKNNMWKFKFNDAISVKGDTGARLHFGVGAQTVGNIMRKHGLKPENYAFWCYDEWYDDLESVESVIDEKNRDVTDTPNNTYSRYGIRYEELLCFIIAAL